MELIVPVFAAVALLAFAGFVVLRLWRGRRSGISIRMQVFVTMAAISGGFAALLGLIAVERLEHRRFPGLHQEGVGPHVRRRTPQCLGLDGLARRNCRVPRSEIKVAPRSRRLVLCRAIACVVQAGGLHHLQGAGKRGAPNHCIVQPVRYARLLRRRLDLRRLERFDQRWDADMFVADGPDTLQCRRPLESIAMIAPPAMTR